MMLSQGSRTQKATLATAPVERPEQANSREPESRLLVARGWGGDAHIGKAGTEQQFPMGGEEREESGPDSQRSRQPPTRCLEDLRL